MQQFRLRSSLEMRNAEIQSVRWAVEYAGRRENWWCRFAVRLPGPEGPMRVAGGRRRPPEIKAAQRPPRPGRDA
jgi:hypothetical protein